MHMRLCITFQGLNILLFFLVSVDWARSFKLPDKLIYYKCIYDTLKMYTSITWINIPVN